MKKYLTRINNLAIKIETNVDLSWWSDITTKIDPLQIILTNYGDFLLNFCDFLKFFVTFYINNVILEM